MRSIYSTLSSKGRATIPIEVRRHLGIAANDKLVFVIEDDGSVRIQAAKHPTLESISGAAGSLKQPLSWEEVRAIAREDYVASMRARDE